VRGAFRQAGLPVTIRRGEVYYIADSYVHFADAAERTRTARPNRYILVLQGDEYTLMRHCPTVLVAPMSSQTNRKRPWEFFLPDQVGGQPGDSIVKVHLAQPVPREALEQGELRGRVPSTTMQQIYRQLLVNLGVVPGQDAEPTGGTA
jgi:hypothetical protein